jgi:hypothetical protein
VSPLIVTRACESLVLVSVVESSVRKSMPAGVSVPGPPKKFTGTQPAAPLVPGAVVMPRPEPKHVSGLVASNDARAREMSV